jgi:hypothetical protein
MQIRRGTLAAWDAASNPVLEPGELGFVTDTGLTAFKVGDGSTGWDTLPYVNSTYPELLVTGGTNLDLAVTQGRYPLSSLVTYTSSPALPSEYAQGVTDGDSILTVTVPSSGIVIQQINTSLTAKQFLRARNGSTWTAWKRIDTLLATDSLSITNITLSGNLTVGGIISVPDGSAAAPSITNTGDTDTGLYFPAGDNTVGITTNGVLRAQFGTTSAITGNISVAGGISATGSGGSISASQGISGLGVSVTTNGLISSGGLSVTAGGSTLAVPLALGTATAAGTSVFSTKNTSGTVVTTIRGDGVPTATTDLTTKTYIDTNFAALSAIMPKPQTAAGVGQIVSLADIYTGGGGGASVTVGAAGQTWAYVGFWHPDVGNTSQNKVGVVTAATSVSGPNNTDGMVWVAAIRLV